MKMCIPNPGEPFYDALLVLLKCDFKQARALDKVERDGVIRSRYLEDMLPIGMRDIVFNLIGFPKDDGGEDERGEWVSTFARDWLYDGADDLTVQEYLDWLLDEARNKSWKEPTHAT